MSQPEYIDLSVLRPCGTCGKTNWVFQDAWAGFIKVYCGECLEELNYPFIEKKAVDKPNAAVIKSIAMKFMKPVHNRRF